MRKPNARRIVILLFIGTGLLSVLSCKKTSEHSVVAVLPVQITAISVDSGGAGAVVTLTGSNFSPKSTDNLVNFNGVAATVLANDTATYDHTTTLQVRVPQRAGTGAITVTNSAGSVATWPVFNYVYNITVSTLAGGGSPGSPGSGGYADGAGRYALFNQPWGIAVDSAGNIYVADNANNCIRKITPDGTTTTFAGSGRAGFADGKGKDASFSFPAGLALDRAGNLYVADWVNSRVRKITPDGVVSTLAGTGVSGFTDGPVATATFGAPLSVAVDSAGNVFVTDYDYENLREITTDGQVTTVSFPGSAQFPGFISSTAFDAQNNLYFTDFSHGMTMEVAGGFNFTLGGTGSGGYQDGVGTSAGFSSPMAICVDKRGDIYVSDIGNSRIRNVVSKGGLAANPPACFGFFRVSEVSTVAGNGKYGYVDGPAAKAEFGSVYGIAVDGQGNLYIADQTNNCIREIFIL